MNSPAHRLLLASASERRRRLLTEAGVSFEVIIPDVEESDCSRSTRTTVLLNAELKRDWAVERHPDCTIIAADTALDFDGQLIGKPGDMDAARKQLSALSGHTHTVLTGIACVFPGNELISEVCKSLVTFKNLSDAMIDEYFSLVDPLDKAGSYDIGSHGDIIVAQHEGSFTNIVGLPMERITALLKEHGYLQ